MKFSWKNFALFSMFVAALIFMRQAFADDFVPTSEIVKEIEKTLLFDKEAREKINFYKNKK